MKIAIIGYSGSGKSTIARKLGEYYSCQVLHLDTVQYAPNWIEREYEEKKSDVAEFLKNDDWVIDGNYSKFFYEERMEKADQIIFMNFNRFNCLWRVFKRYRTYKGTSRPDMTVGCNEKLDYEFILWILRNGRSKAARERYRQVVKKYSNKSVILKNQRDIDNFIKNLK